METKYLQFCNNVICYYCTRIGEAMPCAGIWWFAGRGISFPKRIMARSKPGDAQKF